MDMIVGRGLTSQRNIWNVGQWDLYLPGVELVKTMEFNYVDWRECHGNTCVFGVILKSLGGSSEVQNLQYQTVNFKT